MAVRSAIIINEVVQSQRRRSVPTAGTLENPPGSDTGEEGPAWALPELISFEKDLGAVTALFNTCAHQSKVKYKWFKPGRFTGCLAELGTLSRKCKCPGWSKHQALVGKDMTSRAAEYPEELCRAYAVLVVKTFKTTLQMEWWREALKRKKEEVSDAQVRWLASKGKRQQPPARAQDLEASRRVWMADNVEVSSGPTRRAIQKEAKRGRERSLCGRHEKSGQGSQQTEQAGRCWT
jgi:hypothetical protein